MATDDLMPVITAHRRAFGTVLAGLAAADRSAPSLCAGWRVREVVAHMTMVFRYPALRLLLEMVRSAGNFPAMSDRGALTHDVVHGLDITVPLGIEHPVSEPALRAVLENATTPLSPRRSRVDLTGIRLTADDLDWTFGDGDPLRGRARDLLLVLMNRRLPAALLSGVVSGRFVRG